MSQKIYLQWTRLCNYLKKEKTFKLSMFIIISCIIVPMLVTGIICNDELQYRFWSYQGFIEFIKHFMSEQILDKGRALSAMPFSIATYLGFVSQNLFVFKFVSIIVIISNIAMFSYFINKLFKNKWFAIFTFIMALIFLPISFELTPPNAYLTQYSIAFNLLLISFILFIDYMKENKKKTLIVSMILLYIGLISYETFITFTPIYLILCIIYTPKQHRNIKEIAKKLSAPVLVSVIYLGLYIVMGKIFVSNYDGNKLTFVSFKNSFDIILQLFKSSLPGYFLFNKKYQYLISIFISGKNIFEIFNLRIIILIPTLFITLKYIFKNIDKGIKENSKDNSALTSLILALLGCIFIIMPHIPIALAKSYQGVVNAEQVMALPTSYFSYFSAIFVISYILFKIVEKLGGKIIVVLASLAIVFYMIPIQGMNDIISKEQNRNYNRLINIENMFDTNIISSLNNQEITAKDLYKTVNAMGIHDGYWSNFAKLKKLDIQILNEVKSEKKFNIYYQDDEFFVLSKDNDITVLSPKILIGFYPVKINDDNYKSMEFKQYIKDGKLYIYNFK
ncbi:hypothetical protein CHF27_008965 [Romboutsia maritimum]|uniref:Glycosyltransferase RgtA/B/C/D-like domain-containing protein n=1 Tax=Romboutsia maritimum TaxID=2020948 RepID=A0A371IS20_9FIRM|nr:hypothetical protein [Romboutsia maritimum]RDY23265.1 hypothetical protein CHF27_008965 [Romboutsia maritimum]